MAARTVARYQVGGHLLMVSAADGTDVRSLLPSYERFGVEDDGAEPLVHVDVDPSRAMDKPEREVGQFDCGGCVHGVFLMPDGGYQFHLRDEAGTLCCLMQASHDFRSCRAHLCADTHSRQAYGLNNAVMMAFSFAASFQKALMIHA